MMDNFSHVLLFKTDVNSNGDKLFLHSILDGITAVEKWNLDLEDEDFVLRVVSSSLRHNAIIELLNHHGYNCEELT